MSLHFSDIRYITDMISASIFVAVRMVQWVASVSERLDGFEHRQTVLPSAPEIVNLSGPGPLKELQEKTGNIVCVDLVSDLLAVVSVYRVRLPQDGAAYDVGQVSMKLDSRMLRAGKAATPKNTHRHLKVAPVLLT